VSGAGRTDSGVHALAQIAHVDIGKSVEPWKLMDALNALVRPHPVSVLKAEEAATDFHARFDAIRRVYLYSILNRRGPAALARGFVWRVPNELDVDVMNTAAQRLLGQHDFTTFRHSQCQAKSPVKTLDRCDVQRSGETVQVWCEARSFLHRQVRSMVGTLVEVGLGKMTADDVAAALAAADRSRCGPVAPSDGLYLARVDYAK
jgi:tRNA pseudouridine38-40 synthase